LGLSLKNILNFIEEEFDIITAANLAIQIINVLNSVHSKYIIHNDIKPNNICWGKFINGNFSSQNLFFLVDFGNARDISITETNDLRKSVKSKNKIIHYEDK